MGKKITVSLSVILITFFTFINGYTYVYPSYADSTTDNWTSVTTNQELAEAFRYYCKSRNLAIEGSVLDALTTFTTNNFNTICNTLGIDITALQAHLKRSTDSNGRVQFLFDQFGVTAYNRIFAEFLQNNNLEVGDEVTQQDIYNGASYDGCLLFVMQSNIYNSSSTGQSMDASVNRILYRGTPFIYTTNDVKAIYNNTSVANRLSFFNDSRAITFSLITGNNARYVGADQVLNKGVFFTVQAREDLGEQNGYPCIVKYVGTNNTTYYRLAIYTKSSLGKESMSFKDVLDTVNSNTVTPVTIFITTNNNTINNNTYNDNRQTVINNEGDVYNYDTDDEPPINPPSGGGGGTVTPPSDSGGPDGDISFPDFNFQLPQIEWSLGDLSEKFPFSIPFDLIAFFTVLNAEPQAPSIDANIPLGSWYTWHFQADFSQFNNWATIIRNVEFIAFCIGLIYLTIRLVKG